MTKKPKTVRVSNVEVTRITAAEHRALDRKIRKRHERLIKGKKVDWISHNYEEGLLYVDIQFMDGTHFSLQFSPSIMTEGIEFSDMSSGDDVIVREYIRRRVGSIETDSR
jgi:hypothetical protein